MSRMLRLSTGALLAVALAAQTPALRRGVSVQMAVTTHAAAMPDADLDGSVITALTARGAAYLGVTTMTPAELSAGVKSQLVGHAGQRVYLKADARVPYVTAGAVLDALRSAGVETPILLTAQDEPSSGSYRVPMGIEVTLTPQAAQALVLTAGQTQDAELKLRAQRDGQVVLRVAGDVPFGELVHAADLCRGEGAKVSLASQAN